MFPENLESPLPSAATGSRRHFLQSAGMGFGWLAWQGLNGLRSTADCRASTDTPPRPLAEPTAKRVIWLFMDGGVSHVDSYDPKPELTRLSGQPAKWKPDPLSQAISAGRKWLGSPWEFAQHGTSGLWISSLFPHMRQVVDELCVVRSLVGETPLHGAQSLLMHTGRSIAAAPSIGSWISYGLGSENQQLPGYVLLNNDWIPNGGFQNFASSFLPATHQATLVRAKGVPVDNIQAADPLAVQRAKLNVLQQLDGQFARDQRATEIEASIRNQEIAARMQSLVPHLCDVSGETAETLHLYGVDRENDFDKFYA
ncbi:MAG: DUF1501 domain-containing protein, partial [Planctomycetaceae bacterium]